MKKENWNSMLLKLFQQRPIAFNPMLGQLTNSLAAGVLMSQLLFWWGKGEKKDWIYKTVEEIRAETGLSKREQLTAIKKWKNIGVLETKRSGLPAKRHFKIDTDKLISLLKKLKDVPNGNT